MATLKLNLTDYNIIYVDTTAVISGVGDTPSTASNTLPNVDMMPNNTIYLCRRTNNAYTWGPTNSTNSYSANTKTNSTSNMRIAIIGMPLLGDPLYQIMPDIAKTAWDADAAEFFRIKLYAWNSLQRCNSITDFQLSRVWLERGGTSIPQYTTEGTNTSYHTLQAIELNGSSLRGDCSITYNKFTMADMDVLNMNSNPGYNYNTQWFGTCSNFINVTFSNNYIETYNYNGGRVFNVDGRYSNNTADSTNVYFNNNIVHATMPSWVVSFGNLKELKMIDNHFYITTFQAQNFVHATLNISDWRYLELLNTFIDIKAINPTLTWSGFNNSPAISISRSDDYSEQSAYAGATTIIDDVRIVGISANVQGFSYTDSQSYNVDYINSLDSRIKNISVTSSLGTTGIGSGNYAINISIGNNQRFNVSNIYVNNYNQSVNCSGMRSLTDVNITASQLILSNISYANIDNFEYRGNPGINVVNVTNCDVCNISRVNLLNAPTWLDQKWLYVINSSGINKVIIGQTNIPIKELTSYTLSSTQYNDTVLVANNVNSIAGNYFASNGYYTAESHNVYRSGGAASSIKFSSAASDQRYPLILFPRLLRGLEWGPLEEDAPSLPVWCSATVYIAVRNFPISVINDRFIISIEVPREYEEYSENLTFTKYSSISHGTWAADYASVWNNESSLSGMKCTIPFLITTSIKKATIRMSMDAYTYQAYFYLDPNIIFGVV